MGSTTLLIPLPRLPIYGRLLASNRFSSTYSSSCALALCNTLPLPGFSLRAWPATAPLPRQSQTLLHLYRHFLIQPFTCKLFSPYTTATARSRQVVATRDLIFSSLRIPFPQPPATLKIGTAAACLPYQIEHSTNSTSLSILRTSSHLST